MDEETKEYMELESDGYETWKARVEYHVSDYEKKLREKFEKRIHKKVKKYRKLVSEVITL